MAFDFLQRTNTTTDVKNSVPFATLINAVIGDSYFRPIELVIGPRLSRSLVKTYEFKLSLVLSGRIVISK